MSLLDSLLLDPARLEIWIALRTDGVKGLGTESDPYNGSPRLEKPISVSGLTAAGQEATANATNHGYSIGDVVTIDGVTGTGAKFFNGRFVIYSVPNANSFKYWMTADPGTSSASGTITGSRTFFQFDEIMSSLLANTTIHLGPGVFETRGFTLATPSNWQPKSGWKLLGSGMVVTVLKFVCASSANLAYSAIGNFFYDPAYLVDGLEIADLTVDCNLGGQAIAGYDFPPIACAAINVSGSHIRLRRIRAINFGTFHLSLECFVVQAAQGQPYLPELPEVVDCVIEDCVIEQPALNNYWLSTCLHVGAGERFSDGVTTYHRACVIRNCVVDC
jgi:hypothetical protein